MKLIASDYDHTLRFGDTVEASLIEAINDFRSKGNLFAVVTGRSIFTIYNELKEQNLGFDFIVASNGAMIVDETGKILYENYIDTKVARAMIDYADDQKFPFFVCSDGFHVYGQFRINDERAQMHRLRHVGRTISKEALLETNKMISMVVRGYDQTHLTQLKNEIESHFGAYISCYQNQWVFDVMAKGTSKANGIKEAMKFFDIDEVYAIGDDYNDIPMVAEFNGYCVDNAVEDLKKIAKKSYKNVTELIKEVSHD